MACKLHKIMIKNGNFPNVAIFDLDLQLLSGSSHSVVISSNAVIILTKM